MFFSMIDTILFNDLRKVNVGMKNDTKATIGKLGLLALFMVNIAYMADLAVIPAADSIYTEFADSPMVLLNFILTGPQLLVVVGAIAATVLMQHMSKKDIIVILMIVFGVAEIFALAIRNPYYLALMRAIGGFCGGCVTPVAIALINEIFAADSKKSETYTGIFNGFTSIIGAILSAVAGMLCAIQWDCVFYVYYATIPIVILLILFVPRTPKEKTRFEDSASEGADNSEEKINYFKVGMGFFSMIICFATINYMSYLSSMYVAETGIGNESFAGGLVAILTIAAAVICFLFEPIYSKLGNQIATLMYGCILIGYLLAAFAPSTVSTVICYVFLGLGYGIAMAYFYVYIPSIVPMSKVSTFIALVAAMIGVGTFLSSYLGTFIQTISGQTSMLFVCQVYVVVTGAAMVIMLISGIRSRSSVQK